MSPPAGNGSSSSASQIYNATNARGPNNIPLRNNTPAWIGSAQAHLKQLRESDQARNAANRPNTKKSKQSPHETKRTRFYNRRHKEGKHSFVYKKIKNLGDKAGRAYNRLVKRPNMKYNVLQPQLGKGMYGEASLVRMQNENGTYAVLKRFQNRKDAYREVKQHRMAYDKLRRSPNRWCRQLLVEPMSNVFTRGKDTFSLQKFANPDPNRYDTLTLHDWWTSGGNKGEPDGNAGRLLEKAKACLHAHGVLHRDLHAGNVIVIVDKTTRSVEGIRIVDWGLAKANYSFPLSEVGPDVVDSRRVKYKVPPEEWITDAPWISAPTYAQMHHKIRNNAQKRIARKYVSKREARNQAIAEREQRERAFKNYLRTSAGGVNLPFNVNVNASPVRHTNALKRLIINKEEERVGRKKAVSAIPTLSYEHRAKRITELLKRKLLKNAEIYELREHFQSQRMRNERARQRKRTNRRALNSALRQRNRLKALRQNVENLPKSIRTQLDTLVEKASGGAQGIANAIRRKVSPHKGLRRNGLARQQLNYPYTPNAAEKGSLNLTFYFQNLKKNGLPHRRGTDGRNHERSEQHAYGGRQPRYPYGALTPEQQMQVSSSVNGFPHPSRTSHNVLRQKR